jgi:hypothetical protein
MTLQTVLLVQDLRVVVLATYWIDHGHIPKSAIN